MANWVTLPNGVHIDLDDPNNPITGDGTFESYLGGGKSGDLKVGQETIKNGYVIRRNSNGNYTVYNGEGHFEDANHKGQGYSTLKEAIQRADSLPKGIAVENKIEFKDDPTMSGKDSKSFDRDLELAFKEFDGDEDAILDALRSTGKDYGMSNGDLQGVVEAYVMTHSVDDGGTKQTIWNDKSHPLYGIAPSEQNEDYLKSAIREMKGYSDRWSTMKQSEKNEISPDGKAALDKQISRYIKALSYIKNHK